MDDFMVLIPRKKINTPSVKDKKKANKPIGEHILIKPKNGDQLVTAINRNRFTIYGTSRQNGYITQFPVKSWQHKAWNLIGRGINWTTVPPFSSNKHASKKLKHVVRIGVAMKVWACAPLDGKKKTGKPVIMRLVQENSCTGAYLVGCTMVEMFNIFENMYDMIYDRADEVVDTIDKWGFGEAVYTMKAFVIYDDKSFDTIVGNPHRLFDLLGIEFTKDGRVKL